MRSLRDITKKDYGLSSFPFTDVEEFISSQNIEYTKSGDWLKMRCILPFGHKDHSPSMFIHSKHGGVNCYVCGSMSWSKLCEAMEWEVDIESVIVEGVPDVVWKDTQDRIKHINIGEKPEKPKPIPTGLKKITNKVGDPCFKHYKYLESRNIANLITLFNIGYVCNGDNNYGLNFVNRVVIPCHDENGKYLWCEGRAITHSKVNRKYYRPFGINKNKHLFNIHRVILANYNWVVVVEGIIDAMILWSWNIPAVCCFGSSISDEQISLLTKFDTVYLCLDNDPAGIKGWISAKNKMVGIGLKINRILLPKNKDINDINKKIFLKLLTKSNQSK